MIACFRGGGCERLQYTQHSNFIFVIPFTDIKCSDTEAQIRDGTGTWARQIFIVCDMLSEERRINMEGKFGEIDYILLANSYWINDDTPCLTYGLRGVMHATVCVESSNSDLHSGVDGSYMVNEPLSDLMSLITKLKGPRNRVMLPGFYDGILPLTEEEEARYDDIISVLLQHNDGLLIPAHCV